MSRRSNTIGVRDLLARGFHPPRSYTLTPVEGPPVIRSSGYIATWKQPGRRYGPAPQQAYPQHQTPMTEDRRRGAYVLQNGGGALTARQARRWRHKRNRFDTRPVSS